jgi:hypothetical protein
VEAVPLSRLTSREVIETPEGVDIITPTTKVFINTTYYQGRTLHYVFIGAQRM